MRPGPGSELQRRERIFDRGKAGVFRRPGPGRARGMLNDQKMATRGHCHGGPRQHVAARPVLGRMQKAGGDQVELPLRKRTGRDRAPRTRCDPRRRRLQRCGKRCRVQRKTHRPPSRATPAEPARRRHRPGRSQAPAQCRPGAVPRTGTAPARACPTRFAALSNICRSRWFRSAYVASFRPFG